MQKTMYSGRWPHTEYLDFHGDGTRVECLVLKNFNNGDKIVIKANDLEGRIDRSRMGEIIQSKEASFPNMELYEVLLNKTLTNGENALKYFHQYAWILTSNGRKHKPQLGKHGAVNEQSAPSAKAPEPLENVQTGDSESETKKSPGRPPSKK